MGTNKDWEVKRRKYPARLPRGRAIKLYCKEECCAGEVDSWRQCTITNCFLWKFRLGKEILGNSTSFKKLSKKTLVLPLNSNKNEVLEEVSGVGND